MTMSTGGARWFEPVRRAWATSPIALIGIWLAVLVATTGIAVVPRVEVDALPAAAGQPSDGVVGDASVVEPPEGGGTTGGSVPVEVPLDPMAGGPDPATETPETEPATTPPPPTSVVASTPPPPPAGVALRLGVTHTQFSVQGGSGEAIRRAEALLASRPGSMQNIWMMGAGASNPEPSPGQFDWHTLDVRMTLIARTGGTPVLTLCCAPDWMKGGEAGSTDWSTLGTAPRPEHYADFAALAREAALRYPQIRHFLVWSELRGFWDHDQGRWNYEGYTDLYNQVFDALKSVDPAIQVGGPYVALRAARPGTITAPSTLSGPWGQVDQRGLDAIDHWLAHAHGADFIVLDGGTAPAPRTTEPAATAAMFGAATTWVRARSPLPIWWSELYPFRHDAPGLPVEEQDAAWRAALDAIDGAGGAVVLYWQPEQRAAAGDWQGLWTETSVPAGGTITPLGSWLLPLLDRPP